MSSPHHYQIDFPCPLHTHCHLSPSERCNATTQAGTRCERRAAPGSLYCAGSHGGPQWSPEISAMRRGHPLELVHNLGSGSQLSETFPNAPLAIVELWGQVSDEQLGAVVGEMDAQLEELLA